MEPASSVAEVVHVLGKDKCLIKISAQGKQVVGIHKDVDISKLTPNTRVALRADSQELHYVLPTNVDPLVSLMRVEKQTG